MQSALALTLKMEKCTESCLSKTTVGIIFNLQNSNLLTLSVEEVFQVNSQNWPVANLPVVDFCPLVQEMSLPMPLNM